jgi:L-serine deaminase
VSKAVKGMVTKIAEVMMEIDMMTAEAMTIIVKAMMDWDLMSECKEGGWTRRYL